MRKPLDLFIYGYDRISERGLSIFIDYGKLLLLLVGTMLVVSLILNPILVAISLRRNPYPLVFRCLRESAVMAFFMRNSAANTIGLDVSIGSAIVLSFISTLAACGTSGVAGGSLLLIPMACSLFGIPQDTAMQMVGVGYIINVVQDSFETALNSSGDVLFTATAEYHDWIKKGKELPKFL